MACEKCDNRNERQEGIAFYRWKTANIGMMGCDEHLREIFNVLNGLNRNKPKPENWETTFRLFYSDEAQGSASWLVTPMTVRTFIHGLLEAEFSFLRKRAVKKKDIRENR